MHSGRVIQSYNQFGKLLSHKMGRCPLSSPTLRETWQSCRSKWPRLGRMAGPESWNTRARDPGRHKDGEVGKILKRVLKSLLYQGPRSGLDLGIACREVCGVQLGKRGNHRQEANQHKARHTIIALLPFYWFWRTITFLVPSLPF